MNESVPPMTPRMVRQALTETIPHEVVPVDQVVAGTPATGFVDFGVWQGLDVGVWEMTEGSMRDIEVEEVFVVISGDATLTRTRDGAQESISLTPGVVCHLESGEVTTWEVRNPLRKIYFTPSE